MPHGELLTTGQTGKVPGEEQQHARRRACSGSKLPAEHEAATATTECRSVIEWVTKEKGSWILRPSGARVTSWCGPAGRAGAGGKLRARVSLEAPLVGAHEQASALAQQPEGGLVAFLVELLSREQGHEGKGTRSVGAMRARHA